MKIGYFADGPWAHRALDLINSSKEFEVAFICTRFDTQDPVLKVKGAQYGIPVITSPNINSADFLLKLKEFKCDLLVSMSFNQIFKRSILDSTDLGIINCHAGKLPFYRGRNILNWALINDEKEFGITVHFVDEGIDTGDIILQETYPIGDTDTYGTLLETAQIKCADLLFAALKAIKNRKFTRISQETIHPVGFYCTRRVPGDERIDWRRNSRDLFNFVRAISVPGPKATTTLNGNIVKINKAKLIPLAPVYEGVPGSILSKTSDGFLVKTLDSFIEISEIECQAKMRVGDRFV